MKIMSTLTTIIIVVRPIRNSIFAIVIALRDDLPSEVVFFPTHP